MASFEILLIRVRSETPTSFFLVVSKTAFVANWALGAALAAGWPPTALRAARLVFPYTTHALAECRLYRGGFLASTMVDARSRAATGSYSRPAVGGSVCLTARGIRQR